MVSATKNMHRYNVKCFSLADFAIVFVDLRFALEDIILVTMTITAQTKRHMTAMIAMFAAVIRSSDNVLPISRFSISSLIFSKIIMFTFDEMFSVLYIISYKLSPLRNLLIPVQ